MTLWWSISSVNAFYFMYLVFPTEVCIISEGKPSQSMCAVWGGF